MRRPFAPPPRRAPLPLRLVALLSLLVLALLPALPASPARAADAAAGAGGGGTVPVVRRTPVVLVHGYGDTANAFRGVEDRLMAAGYAGGDLASFGYDWTRSNAANADAFGAFLEERFPGRAVNVVAHSMGSLLTRAHLKAGGSARVRAWVSLGGPNHGTGQARYCAPFGAFCDLHAASLADMAPGSDFLTALNSGDETPGPTRYLTFSSACDTQVPPEDSFAPRTTDLAGAVNLRLPVDDSGCPSHQGLLDSPWVWQRILREFAADPTRTVDVPTGPFRITVDQARLTGSDESAPELFDGIGLSADGTERPLWHRDRADAIAFPDWDPWFGLDEGARGREFTERATISVGVSDADRTAGNNDDVLAAGRVHWDPAVGVGRHTVRFRGVDGGEVTVVYTVAPVTPTGPPCRARVDSAELVYFDDGSTRPALYGEVALRAGDGSRDVLWSRPASDPSTFPNRGGRADPDPWFHQRIGSGAVFGPAPVQLQVRVWDFDKSSADDLVARGSVEWNPWDDRPGTRVDSFRGDDGGHVRVTWTVLCDGSPVTG
ncbi:esterase/lipase family protein (plasmid) [Streptomyces sp. BI20]|uniref:esterase/lipase family protein n=1 Tax=Streptomyces sp. BI20 TaxID=3403460 RepID=UPI003C71CA5F